MTYPILYSPGHTDFNNLGLGVMVGCTTAIVSEELNGKFELDIKYLAYAPLAKYLVNDAQIKVDTGDQTGQLFRIKSVGKNIDGIIPIHAEHVSYITNDLPIKPKIFVPNANGALALQSALNNIISNHPLTSFSDVTTASDLSWELPTFKNIRNILGGVEGSILDKIGGEYQFNNYQIRLLSQRGRYSNTIIAYGRNLTDFKQEENILEVYTSIYPIVVESKDNTQTVKTLPEYIIDGEYVDKYPNRRVTIIDFSDKFNDKNLYSEDKLRKLAQDYVKTNKIGVPKFSMTVSTVDLSGALDDSYNVEEIESLHLADTVKVFFEPLGVTEEAKVVGSVWNVLLDQYDSYTLGAKKASFGQWVNNSINEVKNEADSAKRNALEAVASANGKNTNYYGNSGGGFPPNPNVGDLYFQKDGDKTTIYQWDGSSWVNLIDTSWQDDFEADIQGKLDQAKEETNAALAEKDKAINDLDKKVTDKITQTNTAVTQAQSDANAAKTQADAAVAKANSNTVTINAAKIDITKALNDSTSALNAIKLVDGRVDSVTTTIANVKSDVDKKADKTAVASQISQSATEIRQDLQSWTNGQLTNYSTIQSTATSIASAVSSKADKSQITQLSDQITSVVSSSGQNNLVYNSTFQDSIDGWRVQNGYKQTTARNIGGNYSIEFKLPENPNGSWNFARSKKVPIGVFKNYAYSVSIMRMVDIPNTGFFAYGVEGYDESGNRLEWKTVNIHSSLSDYVWVLLTDTFTFTNPNVKTVSFVFTTNGYGHYLACQPIMVNDKNVGSFVPDGMNKSQITQLSDDINLRVIKGDVVNQINISPESILIAGNKIQITGQTYIENGIIGDAKIKDLSASKLTAGTIDAAKINVLNINAANITTGILNADRIGANSINATHINVANLAAISADLGIITAGIINAATVRIINLDAGAISTGTLNANRIAAYSITADKIQATSLDLFNADFYTNVQADGMRMQGKAQIIFGKWKDSSGVVRNSEGLYIGGYNAGVKYVALTRADGSTFMLRANSDMDIGTNTNVAKESLNIYDTVHLWYPQINHSDLTLNGYFAMGGGIQEGSIQYDKNAGTMNFRVPGGRSGSYFWFNQNVNAAGTFNTVSRLSLKNVKGEYKGDALKEICDTNIVEYSYKNNPKARQLSPIIDDVNKIKQFTLPDIINDGKTVNLYAMSSLSWIAIQELAKKLENIEEKIDAIA
ncbi:phage tail spike protein [Lactococcus lactis]|uniref:phage tail spike protein n=1 Tax=Lactococcus lactis TaxID=1358 RepID=UPI0028914779|nr:phage tail spike protein [Lactococcus lactis]MDT2858169.1 phage tail spike protein [Lactococcus lactis]